MSKKKSVQTGIIAFGFFAIIIIAFVILWYYSKQMESRQIIEEESRKQTELLIDRIIEIKSEKYANIVHDNSAWDELIDFMNDYDSSWVDDNIGYMVDVYQAASVMLFDSTGNKYYENVNENFIKFDFFNMTSNEFVGLFKDTCFQHYYQMKNNAIFEFFCAGIVSSGDIYSRQERSQGYLCLTRLIDRNVLTDLQNSLGDIQVGLVANLSDLDRLNIDIKKKNIITRELKNFQNQPVGYFYFISTSLQNIGYDVFTVTIIILAMFITIIMLFVGIMYLKLIRPVKQISKAIDNNDTNSISLLLNQNTEYGKISNTINNFIIQKTELEQTSKALDQKRAEVLEKSEDLIKIREEYRTQREDFRMLRDDYQTNVIENDRKDLEIKDLKYQLNKMSKVLQSSKNELITINEFMNQRESELQDNNNQLVFNHNYSRIFQNVILSVVAPTNTIFKNCFKLFDPQDTIGNCFYYTKKIGNTIAVAVGDCSPLGVPGVLLSSMTIIFLDTLFVNNPTISPNELLCKLRDNLQRNVGVDYYGNDRPNSVCISLLIFDKETYQGNFAGAARQMLLVRNYKITTIKGDELPIGPASKGFNFQNIAVQLQQSDIVYLCTDGYDSTLPIQEKTSMVSTEQFRHAVLKNSVSPMEIQKQRLTEIITEWRGQIGDVAIVGFSL